VINAEDRVERREKRKKTVEMAQMQFVEILAAKSHDSIKLELPEAWEPVDNSRPLLYGKEKEAQHFVSYGNKV
jgi:hypothetical protein